MTAKLSVCALCALALSLSAAAAGADAERFRDMSLEDLLSVQVYLPATLTKLTPLESPTAITTISAADIALTPARNIYDLIEVYVPGALWMNQETGPVLGVRGNITSRNHRFLLLVDGVPMNNKSFAGASSELEMWDLDDIERIEVVRGPGAVTYGPGAVAGVISITTRAPGDAPGTTASASYIGPYASRSLRLSHSMTSDAFALYAHASITDTRGQEARLFQVERDITSGFVGHDNYPEREALDYYGDFDGDPQLKLQLNLDLPGEWHWRSRYTEQGAHWFSNEPKTDIGGTLVNRQGTRSRQISTQLEHGVALGETLALSTRLSLESLDFARRRDRLFHPELESPLNYQVRFAESELLAHATLNWQPSARAQVAVGAEWSHDRFGPGWGDGNDEMRNGESGEIVSGPGSEAVEAGNRNDANRHAPDWPAIGVGKAWDTDTQSVFFEGSLQVVDGHTLLLSGRADKNTYEDWLFSPRAAWIWTVARGHVLKLVAQRAARMNTASQMYVNHRNGIENKPEELDSLALRYSARIADSTDLEIGVFHDDAEVIAFQNIDNNDRHVGKLKLNGIEASLRHDWERASLGASVSWVKLQDWTLAPGVLASGVSYADYNLQVGGADGGTLRGTGDDLNNWPNASIKAFGNIRIGDRLTLHIDARWFSEMKGAKDGLDAYDAALTSTALDTPLFREAMRRVAEEDAYDSDFRLDALLDYALTPRSSIQLFGQNLLCGDHNRRYSYDEATLAPRPGPSRVRFVEESQLVGIRLSHRF